MCFKSPFSSLFLSRSSKIRKEKNFILTTGQLAQTPKPVKTPAIARKPVSSAKKQIFKNETTSSTTNEKNTKPTFHAYLFDTYVKVRHGNNALMVHEFPNEHNYEIEKLTQLAHINLDSNFLLYVNEWIDYVKLAVKLKQKSSHMEFDEYKMFDYFEKLHDYYLQNVQGKKTEFIAEFHATFTEFLKILFHFTSILNKTDEKKKEVSLMNTYWTNLIQRMEKIFEFCDKESKLNSNVMLSVNLSFLKAIKLFVDLFTAEIYKTRAKDWFLYSKLFKLKEDNLYFVLNKFETLLINRDKIKRCVFNDFRMVLKKLLFNLFS
jgi:hypothetical protein